MCFSVHRLGYGNYAQTRKECVCLPGYKSWQGTVTTAEQLWDLIEGLKANDLLQYSHLVTGESCLFKKKLR